MMETKFTPNANSFALTNLVTIAEGDPESKYDADPMKASKKDLIEIIKFLKQRNDEIWYLIDESREKARIAKRDIYLECARAIRSIASDIDTTKMIGNDVVTELLDQVLEWEA